MAETNNILMQQYNGTDYDTVYPQTLGTNIITPVPLTAGGGGGETATESMYNLMSNLSAYLVKANIATGDYLAITDISGSITSKLSIAVLGQYLAANYGIKGGYGVYSGNGTYGSSNPNKIVPGFVPKLIIVSDLSAGLQTNPSGAWHNGFIAVVPSSSSAFTIPVGTDDVTGTMVLSKVTNGISWYSTSVEMQCNRSSTAYQYLALG